LGAAAGRTAVLCFPGHVWHHVYLRRDWNYRQGRGPRYQWQCDPSTFRRGRDHRGLFLSQLPGWIGAHERRCVREARRHERGSGGEGGAILRVDQRKCPITRTNDEEESMAIFWSKKNYGERCWRP